MIRTRKPGRSASARLHNISHPSRYTLLMLVVTALVAGMGARFAAPRAAAATGDQTFESGDYSITLTQNNTITILDKKTSTALQGTPDTTTQQISEDEIRTKAEYLTTQLKNNLGWDVALDSDRIRLTQEINTFHQKLHSIPQATLNLTENTDIRTLRDTIDQTYEDTECRGRCLEILPVHILIVGGLLAWSIRSIRDKMYRNEEISLVVASGGICYLGAVAMVFWNFLSTTLDDPHFPAGMKRVLLLLAGAIFNGVARTVVELSEYTAQSRKTVPEDLTEAAQRVHSLTPGTEPASDYDLVKDEL